MAEQNSAELRLRLLQMIQESVFGFSFAAEWRLGHHLQLMKCCREFFGEVFYYEGSCFRFVFLQWLARETDYDGLQIRNLSLKVFRVVEYKINVSHN